MTPLLAHLRALLIHDLNGSSWALITKALSAAWQESPEPFDAALIDTLDEMLSAFEGRYRTAPEFELLGERWSCPLLALIPTLSLGGEPPTARRCRCLTTTSPSCSPRPGCPGSEPSGSARAAP